MANEAFYEDNNFRFVPNPRDGPQAYDIHVGEDHFYMPDRILDDLTYRSMSTPEVASAFDQLTQGTAQAILKAHNLTYQDLHIALLKVRMKEMEREQADLSLRL